MGIQRLMCLLTYICFVIAAVANGVEYKRVCYFSNSGQGTPGWISTPDIDPHICTHIVYAFATVQGGKLQETLNSDLTEYNDLVRLKTRNSNLTVMISVGGSNWQLREMSVMLSSFTNRTLFISSCIIFLRRHGFDGLDINFIHPGKSPDSVPDDKIWFGLLLMELREAFQREATINNLTRLLISVVVPTSRADVETGYAIQPLIKGTDYISLLTYVYHPWPTTVTSHNAPLYEKDPAGEFGTETNMYAGALYWASLGVSREKLLIGLAGFGWGYTLSDVMQTTIGAPVLSQSPYIPASKGTGFETYIEACRLITSGGKVMNSEESQVPYVVKGNLWFAYDNQQSLRNKVRWLKMAGFGGIMFWEIQFDDASGQYCSKGFYPLLTAVRDELNATPAPPLPPPSYITRPT